ncbi:helicase superfamily 3 (plasmid) [Calothrix sp. NIES-4101]|nr:helicase superfamily 3 [Calothrix sp. NIES-4101]
MYATTSTSYQQSESFDIRNFSDRLTPTKEKNRYCCPVCDGHNLTIDPKTGKYKCWNGCECRDIREAVSPWSELKCTRGNNHTPLHNNFQPQFNYQKPMLTRSQSLAGKGLHPKKSILNAGDSKGNQPVKPFTSPQSLPSGKDKGRKAGKSPHSNPQSLSGEKNKGIKAEKPSHSNASPLQSSQITLLKLSQGASDFPQPQKPKFIPKRVKELVEEAQTNIANSCQTKDLGNGVIEYIQTEVSILDTLTQTTYIYSDSQQVHRFDWCDASKSKGRGKTFMQCHIAADGTTKWTKGDKPWRAYRLEEAIATAKQQTESIAALLCQEGEKCVEIARMHGIASFTFQGSNWRPEEIKPTLEKIKDSLSSIVMVFLHDPDPTGLKKAEIFKKCCAEVGLPCILVNPKQICDRLPHDTGDIEEILAQMDVPEFIRKLEEEIHNAIDGTSNFEEIVNEDSEFFDSIPDSFEPNIEITQKAMEMLYGDKPWICVENQLYYWEDTHYKVSSNVVELKRISNFCNKYPVFKKDEVRFPYANPGTAEKILRWVKMRLGIDPKLVNPPGINCTNGVLQIYWVNDLPKWQLIDHSPNLYYTYKPIATYNPKADQKHCDRLMAALEPAQQKIFLRTIAASLDLATVRKYKGRLIKGLLCQGSGNNGKDTLREVVSLMYGKQGITGCTLADFAAYDDGRKFPLAKLRHSRINWASENTNTSRLDKIQSLKVLITGEELDAERKGIDAEEFTPNAIALFNVNDTPNLQATLEAIASRYAVLSFNKTYVSHPDPKKGELLADPRFKYDPIFMQTMVVPAFLNLVLQALVDLMVEGIDYNSTEEALLSIQAENCHLLQFSQDVGLGYDPNSTLTSNEIWTVLEQWYRDNGTLDYEETKQDKLKAIWVEQAKSSDKNVKAPNQVIPRFLQIFPKAKKVTVAHPSGKKTILAIQGIGFNPGVSPPVPPENSSLSINPTSTPISIPSTPIPPQTPPQETLLNQDFHPNHPNSSNQNGKFSRDVETQLNAQVNVGSQLNVQTNAENLLDTQINVGNQLNIQTNVENQLATQINVGNPLNIQTNAENLLNTQINVGKQLNVQTDNYVNNIESPTQNNYPNNQLLVETDNYQTKQKPEQLQENATSDRSLETNPSTLGWVGCNAQSTSIIGVETGVETGVLETPIGVQPTTVENYTTSNTAQTLPTGNISGTKVVSTTQPITINKGTRVRIKPHTFGSSQDGKEGVVLRIKEFECEGVKKTKYVVWLDDLSVGEKLRQVECYAIWLDVVVRNCKHKRFKLQTSQN